MPRHSVKFLIFCGAVINNFKQDIIDLFSRKKGGHIDHWLYSDALRENMTGSQLWHEFLRASKNYYVLPNEIALIAQHANEISKQMNDVDTVVDFGVGDDLAIVNKALPIIKGIESAKTYIGIDISAQFLQAACKRVANDTALETQCIQSDFYKLGNPLTGQKRLGMMFGSTITNQNMMEGEAFPHEAITGKLGRLKNVVGEGGKMLINYDGNRDSESVLKAYDHVFWSRHVTGIAYDIANIAQGDFKIDSWAHKRIWDKNAHVLHQCIEATQDQHFSINEHDFRIKKGARFVAVNNFKYPSDIFKSLAHNAGFEVGPTYSDPQSRMHIQTLSVA